MRGDIGDFHEFHIGLDPLHGGDAGGREQITDRATHDKHRLRGERFEQRNHAGRWCGRCRFENIGDGGVIGELDAAIAAFPPDTMCENAPERIVPFRERQHSARLYTAVVSSAHDATGPDWPT